MNVIEFKRDNQGLIIVWGTEVLDELGYSARDGENISRISTANEAPEAGVGQDQATVLDDYMAALGYASAIPPEAGRTTRP